MIKLSVLRTDSSHPQFAALVKQLDEYLAVIDGSEHDFYNQFNNIDVLNHVVLAFKNDQIVGCGAFKPYDLKTIEIKRMYTHPDARGMGMASLVLAELESWAMEKGFFRCVLETGIKMPDAIALYTKLGYHETPNYGQYEGKELSRCFSKTLK
jgi:GNAT superfamily N-acetyltransferase